MFKFLSSDYLLVIPTQQSYLNFLIFFYSVFLVFVFAYVIVYRIKHDKNRILKVFRKKFFWGNLSLGATGLFLVFSRYQELPIFSLRITNYFLLLLIVSYNVYLTLHYKKNVVEKLFQKKEKERIEKWLPKKNKKA